MSTKTAIQWTESAEWRDAIGALLRRRQVLHQVSGGVEYATNGIALVIAETGAPDTETLARRLVTVDGVLSAEAAHTFGEETVVQLEAIESICRDAVKTCDDCLGSTECRGRCDCCERYCERECDTCNGSGAVQLSRPCSALVHGLAHRFATGHMADLVHVFAAAGHVRVSVSEAPHSGCLRLRADGLRALLMKVVDDEFEPA